MHVLSGGIYAVEQCDHKADRPGRSGKKKADELWASADVRNSLALCYDRKAFLYQVRPDIMPYDYLSETEMCLWSYYYADMNEKRNSL